MKLLWEVQLVSILRRHLDVAYCSCAFCVIDSPSSERSCSILEVRRLTPFEILVDLNIDANHHHHVLLYPLLYLLLGVQSV
jgi:hypothetical protein